VITCVVVIVELSVVIGCNASLMMSGFSAKSFYKCKRSARLSASSRNATKLGTVSGIHSRQRKARVDEDFLYYTHMPKRKKSTVDVPEVDKADHQTVDVPESSDVLLSDNNAVREDNAVLQTVDVPESTDVVLPDDNVGGVRRRTDSVPVFCGSPLRPMEISVFWPKNREGLTDLDKLWPSYRGDPRA